MSEETPKYEAGEQPQPLTEQEEGLYRERIGRNIRDTNWRLISMLDHDVMLARLLATLDRERAAFNELRSEHLRLAYRFDRLWEQNERVAADLRQLEAMARQTGMENERLVARIRFMTPVMEVAEAWVEGFPDAHALRQAVDDYRAYERTQPQAGHGD